MAELDLTKWSFYNPLGDCSYSISLLDQVSISIPAGVSHDQWASNRNAPRLRQVANNTDFSLEIKIDSPLTIANQGIGILVEQNENNLIRFDVYFNGIEYKLLAASMVNGAMTTRLNLVAPGLTMPFRLRVERTGNQWVFLTSQDGINWVSRVSFDHVITVAYGSIHATTGVNNPALTALIDYFHVDTKRGPLVANLLAMPGSQDIFIVAAKTEISGDAILLEYDFNGENQSDFGVFIGGVLVDGAMAVINPSTDSGAIQAKTKISGSLAATETADGFVADGYITSTGTVIGNLNVTDDPDTVSISGITGITGQLAATESTEDTAVMTGQVDIAGTIEATDLLDQSIMSANAIVSGDSQLSAPPDDTLIGAAGAIVSGAMAAAETSEDSAEITANTIATGVFIGIEPIDTMIAVIIRLFTGNLNAIETKDGFIASGKSAISGQLSATDTKDNLSAVGIVRWPGITGAMAATEVNDSVSGSGNVTPRGNLSPLSVPADVISIFAGTEISGDLSTPEQLHDTCEIDGGVQISGNAELQEATDQLFAWSTVRWPDIIGNMLATENLPDTLNSEMLALISANAVADEAHDAVNIGGNVALQGDLNAIERPDTVVIALRKNTGWLAGTVEVKPALSAIMKVNDAA